MNDPQGKDKIEAAFLRRKRKAAHALANKLRMRKSLLRLLNVLGAEVKSKVVALGQVANDGSRATTNFENVRSGNRADIFRHQDPGPCRPTDQPPPQLVGLRKT